MNTIIQIENLVNKKNLLMWIFIGIAIFIIGNTLIIAEYGFQLFGFFIGILIASVPIYNGWRNEYLLRPISVEVNYNGLLLFPRYGRKPEFVNWRSIIMLNVHLTDPRPTNNWGAMDGFLFAKDNKCFTLFWPLAMAVRESYKEHVGQYPPNPSDE